MSRVFTGLHTRKQILGMDRALFAVFSSTAVYVVVFSPFSLLVKAALSVVAAFVFLWLRAQNKREPDLLKIYLRYAKQADWYEPWPQWRPRRNWRPTGFGDEGVLM